MRANVKPIRKMADAYEVEYSESTTAKYLMQRIENARRPIRASMAQLALDEMITRHGGKIYCRALPEEEWRYLNLLLNLGAKPKE